MTAGPLAPALLALALAGFVPGITAAQPRPPAAPTRAVAPAPDPQAEVARNLAREIDAAEVELNRARLTPEELGALREQLSDLRANANAERDAAEVESAAARRLLGLLGPAPGPNDPAEAPAVAIERQRYSLAVAREEGRARQADLAAARTQSLLDGIGQRRRELLFAELTRRGGSVLNPTEWIGAAHDLPWRLSQRRDDWAAWWNSAARRDAFPGALGRGLLRAALIGAALAALGTFLRRRFGRAGHAVAPSYRARVAATLVDATLFVAAPIAAIAALLGTLVASGAITPQISAAAQGWTTALIALLLGVVGARLVLRPAVAGWRAVPLGNGSARRLAGHIALIAAVVAVDAILKAALFGATGGFGDPDLRTIYEAIVVFSIGGALAGLARRSNWKPGGEVAVIGEGAPPPSPPGARWRRWDGLRIVWLAAITVALLAALAGYARLATFILTNLFYSAAVVALMILGHTALRELFNALTRTGAADARGDLAGWWALRFVEIGLGALALLAILPLWGVGLDEIADFGWRAVHGIKIGDYTFSLLHLFAAIVAFVAIRFLTRVVQRSFEKTVMPQTRLDPGVGNSIRAGIGYVGLALALLTAVAAVGLDLSNVALVAGALSVGIGFGLQNIVNNFVSGIILLIERPIKVGDWVVVGLHEGTVRRISVRATEIETFRRSSVIIPNAEFLSSAVVNWTYADNFGRVDVRVGVAYGSDLEQVERILLDLANDEPRLMPTPAPFVLVLAFGESQIDVELRGVARDVGTMGFIASDLRKKILARFAAEGIEIPLVQRVVKVGRDPTTP